MVKYSSFPLIKTSAAGNDFLLADLIETEKLKLWESEFGGRSRAALARDFCDRFRGLGADGFVILEKDPALDFKWDFYNSDGSRAEMCGNATRAVALYFSEKTGKKKISFGTVTGTVNAEVVSQDLIQVELAPIAAAEWELTSQDGQEKFHYISTGNPHAVVPVSSVQDKVALRGLAMKIKTEPRFQKAGVNVTFVTPRAEGLAESITFERGVEDFTLACGTGAVAAAFSILRGKDGHKLEVRVPGGTLYVVWNNGRPTLIGPARIVAEMRVNPATPGV